MRQDKSDAQANAARTGNELRSLRVVILNAHLTLMDAVDETTVHQLLE
jgi:hypothetical protein